MKVTNGKGKQAEVDITDLSPEQAAEKLRAMFGAPILFPTDLQMHRVCAKRAKKEPPTAMNGITFRRVDGDAVAYAMNGTIAMRVVLEGDAELVPEAGAILPAKAAKLISEAEQDTAALWFIDGGKARIAVDGELHEFRLIDALAFAGEDVFAGHETAKPALRRLNGDATNLVKLQKAMGAEAIEVAQAERGAVFVVPLDKAGIQPVGKMVLFNSIEDGA